MLNTLLAGYPAAPDSYDEMLTADGQPRPFWRTILNQLAGESPEMMQQRIEAVQRQVRENGVTYNVYGDAKGMQRPWDLNVLPLILPHQEWAEIEAAVIQRATLLNRILLDVYGEQRLLAQGRLPPSLIHGHAGFLRPCHGIEHPGNIALHFYAIDLARAPNGRWWVVSDRTQAPSGAGYALENRAVMARVFPDLLRDLKVQNLGGFFDTMRDSLAHWGRQCGIGGGGGPPLRGGEAPLMVLLTPGPHNETYFEHAYLARHLGLLLVEGSDLTVRNGIVWLKTLSGMQRVHVIVRRVDDDFCDPLELRADSALGVPGLTEAARRGNVLITNSLGSSLLESGALLGFLPALSRHLLGEPLKMPNVATWWCGEEAALEEVIDKLDRLVIKPSVPQLRRSSVFGADLSAAARVKLIAQLRANPKNYVAQELVRLSQTPVWKQEPDPGLYPCASGLRVYACATPKGYVVMPGGLTRVATGPDARVITMQHGGGSKDTWVQAKAPVDPHHMPKSGVTGRDLLRDDTHLSSRVAENLFWFGRNAERCDNIARLLRVSLGFLFHVRPDERGAEWQVMAGLCEWFSLVDLRLPKDDGMPLPAAVRGARTAARGLAGGAAVVAAPVPGPASDAADVAALEQVVPLESAAVAMDGAPDGEAEVKVEVDVAPAVSAVAAVAAQAADAASTAAQAQAQEFAGQTQALGELRQSQSPGGVSPPLSPLAPLSPLPPLTPLPGAQPGALLPSLSPLPGMKSAAMPEPLPPLTDTEIESALLLAVVSPDVPGLVQQQQQLYRTASQLRERMSSDNWRALNKMTQRGTVRELPSLLEAMSLLDDAAEASMLMSGYAMDGMNRDLGWRFLSLGRRLERLQFQCLLLQRALKMEADAGLDWLLELSDSIITYRARYQAQPEWLPVLDLLILDGSNPRAVLFQVEGILKTLKKLAKSYDHCGEERLAPLREELLALEPESDLYCGNAYLADLLQRLRMASQALSEQIGVQFFSHTGK